ncbi:hypothetical protein [Prevotella corporis]|uniref:hypothetical protein n=1 Tax=Prevotella corporis TaxID=28128 RepID=UPI0012E3BB16|nr:hypothetical protein [Prevotella corporis]
MKVENAEGHHRIFCQTATASPWQTGLWRKKHRSLPHPSGIGPQNLGKQGISGD